MFVELSVDSMIEIATRHPKIIGSHFFFKILLTLPLYRRLFGFNGGKLRMDERIDLSMSDPDLVPLIVQVCYVF